jgi:hypothetical protein
VAGAHTAPSRTTVLNQDTANRALPSNGAHGKAASAPHRHAHVAPHQTSPACHVKPTSSERTADGSSLRCVDRLKARMPL